MGNAVPERFLACDGTIYNIANYQSLADHINIEFGYYSYFGGDGTTTFAVPDLRGEFLRGTGTNSHTNQGSGDSVGVHQDGTEIPSGYLSSNNGKIYVSNNVYNNGNKFDSSNLAGQTKTSIFSPSSTENQSYGDYGVGRFTVRPTNTSVLYCIKYI